MILPLIAVRRVGVRQGQILESLTGQQQSAQIEPAHVRDEHHRPASAGLICGIHHPLHGGVNPHQLLNLLRSIEIAVEVVEGARLMGKHLIHGPVQFTARYLAVMDHPLVEPDRLDQRAVEAVGQYRGNQLTRRVPH